MPDLPKHRSASDVSTGWNSTHDVLELIVEQQPAVYSALTHKAVKKAVKDVGVYTGSELKLAEEFIQPLKPVKTLTVLISTETSMAPRPEDSATIKDKDSHHPRPGRKQILI